MFLFVLCSFQTNLFANETENIDDSFNLTINLGLSFDTYRNTPAGALEIGGVSSNGDDIDYLLSVGVFGILPDGTDDEYEKGECDKEDTYLSKGVFTKAGLEIIPSIPLFFTAMGGFTSLERFVTDDDGEKKQENFNYLGVVGGGLTYMPSSGKFLFGVDYDNRRKTTLVIGYRFK